MHLNTCKQQPQKTKTTKFAMSIDSFKSTDYLMDTLPH